MAWESSQQIWKKKSFREREMHFGSFGKTSKKTFKNICIHHAEWNSEMQVSWVRYSSKADTVTLWTTCPFVSLKPKAWNTSTENTDGLWVMALRNINPDQGCIVPQLLMIYEHGVKNSACGKYDTEYCDTVHVLSSRINICAYCWTAGAWILTKWHSFPLDLWPCNDASDSKTRVIAALMSGQNRYAA